MEQAPGDGISRLVEELSATLRRVVSESTQVAQALDRIRSEGYGVSVALEATIGVSRAGGRESREDGRTFELRTGGAEASPLKMTPLDKKFLRSLKITVEEED